MFIDYHLQHQSALPTPPDHCLFQYVIGKNGIYLQFERTGLKGCVPLASCQIRGLASVEPYLTLDYPLVSAELISQMLEMARAARMDSGAPLEILFYLAWDLESEGWQLVVPDQIQEYASVYPKDRITPAYQKAIIEAHSHHTMKACFSKTDDRDEQGLKFYMVLGKIFSKPEIAIRLGIYGQFFPIPASTILEMPEDLEDVFFKS